MRLFNAMDDIGSSLFLIFGVVCAVGADSVVPLVTYHTPSPPPRSATHANSSIHFGMYFGKFTAVALEEKFVFAC